MKASFKPDKDIARIATGLANEAVKWAQTNFECPLDWSDDSVESIEELLNILQESMQAEKPDDETIWDFARMLGSYIGEVFRKNHKGRWGYVKLDGQEFPGIESGDELFWPWARAYKRITEGREENVWHYYQSLVKAVS